MARNLFAKGVIGDLAEEIQRSLLAAGFDPKGTDGVYGDDTAAALKLFQAANSLPATGVVDDVTWTALTTRPAPVTAERSLQLTAAFEGHAYTLAKGNFDGAWLTWGIIGFTMKFGRVQQIILNVNRQFPQLVPQCFGANSDPLLHVMVAPPDDQRNWANSITTTGGNLAEPWRSAFAGFGNCPEVRAEQRKQAFDSYFRPALLTAQQFGLKSELGQALCFDIHVQNGGVSLAARTQIRQKLAGAAPPAESELRQIIANAVADSANPTYSEDVRKRKLTFATGTGTVHGRFYVLESWGLSELDAAD